MKPTTVLRAACARAMFTCHGVLVVYSLSMVFRDTWPFYNLCVVGLIVLETSLSLIFREGKEWGIFCPSVFFYLLLVLPGLWVLEVSALSERTSFENCTDLTSEQVNALLGSKTAHIVDVFGIRMTVVLTVENSIYNKVLRQFLPLFLILGRWLMPKGDLTHDQLSQLLLIYLGTAADITDFYDSLQLSEVRCSKGLTILVLVLWTCSLMQFTIFIRPNQTTTHQTGLLKGYLGDDLSDNFRKEMIWAITTIGMQDLPFVIARTYILFFHAHFSPTNVFYLFKNSCIIVILLYRVAVVKSESQRKERSRVEELVRARAVLCRMHRKQRVDIVWNKDMRRKSIKQLSDMMPVKYSPQTANEDDKESDSNDAGESRDAEKKVT